MLYFEKAINKSNYVLSSSSYFLQKLPKLPNANVLARYVFNNMRCRCGSDRDHSLQTNAEVLLLVKLQFLQSDSRLPDELVVSELILVAH